ncbi:acyl carrier protein [Streptomyces sp. ST2-7A]|uniref:acyl carrier protein n=1 Tax=Streptomyces sp. ST2-7A TaxID=2907214 RepID=UPI001F2C2CC4|nr:acyl carrier protein [Streptomyces sp. ST2-7A]MCE7083344.1 acyl carrier protein [Streptomyces sp. ST2-7A]
MSERQFTQEDLKRILSEGAGADHGADLDGDILDVEFEALGYESLALLETGLRIEREYDIKIDDDALLFARTPRDLVDEVNSRLASAGHATGDALARRSGMHPTA